MSGIAGIFRLNDSAPDPARLDAMLDALRHRGPEGQRAETAGPCALGATRLSIIDRNAGDQPFSIDAAGEAHDGKCATLGPLHLIFNGEIYNHRDLRTKLERRGHRFRTDHADTEVLLYGYRQWGTKLPRHLQGMFSIAIWDQQSQTLFLCRDRAGVKPLYYTKQDDDLVFASLMSAVRRGLPADRQPEVDRQALLTFLRYGYTFGRSLNQGINAVPPAHWITVGAAGKIESERYWRPPPISKTSTSVGATEALTEVLTEAVRAGTEADVPLGCFLSGGLNSSVVAALAQQQLMAEGRGPLKTFSVAIPELAYDESQHAKAVAAHIGAEHVGIEATPGSTIDDLAHLIAIYGEPTAQPALLPTYWLSKATRQRIRVAITGIGGDELFGAHQRYQRLRRYQRYGWWLRLNPAGPDLSDDPARQYHMLVRLLDERTISELAPGLLPGDASEIDPNHPADHWLPGEDHVHSAMRWDLEHALPYDVLRRIDHASMAAALELRCPLLTTGVQDLAGHLPDQVLMPGGRASGLLRQVARQFLPPAIAARSRQSFQIPLGDWFRGILHDTAHDHLSGDHLQSLGLNRQYALKCFDEHAENQADHTRLIMALLTLVMWEAQRLDPCTPPTLA